MIMWEEDQCKEGEVICPMQCKMHEISKRGEMKTYPSSLCPLAVALIAQEQ